MLLTLLSILCAVNQAKSLTFRRSARSLEDSSKLARAKDITQNLLSLIWNRYELGGIYKNFFLSTLNVGNSTWDIMKYKFAHKFVEGNKDFLMVFGGSSVTAGHDNYFNQSFPMVFDRRMTPLFDALGIKLIGKEENFCNARDILDVLSDLFHVHFILQTSEVHNIAQGANECYPYDLCYEPMGGHDPDWIQWEQSFNCGHNPEFFEMITRAGYWSKNKAVTLFVASGAWNPSGCPKSPITPPYSDEYWTEESAGLKKVCGLISLILRLYLALLVFIARSIEELERARYLFCFKLNSFLKLTI